MDNQKQLEEKIEELTESLKTYVSTNYELGKLEAAERSAVIGSGLIIGLLVGVVSSLFLFFISLWVGFYLSNLLGDNYSGFGIIAVFYLVLGLFLVFGREKLIKRPIRDKMIRLVFSKQ
ncbi:MAG: phage holin family protein [Bacteroidetes bacterium]|nr:phage holin family protein [Bacteroidota bacterium]